MQKIEDEGGERVNDAKKHRTHMAESVDEGTNERSNNRRKKRQQQKDIAWTLGC